LSDAFFRRHANSDNYRDGARDDPAES